MTGLGIAPGLPSRMETRIRLRVEYVVAALICAAILTLAATDSASARQVHWQHAGASVFGGPGDGSGCTGYRGANLCGWQGDRAFAELQMGSALGGLPNGARIRVLYQHRKLTLVKRDIGLGGGSVGGWPRAIDLWYVPAARLGVHGLAVVAWRRVR